MGTTGDGSHKNPPKPANLTTTRRSCTIRPRTFQLSDRVGVASRRHRRCNLGGSTQPDLPRNKGTEAEQTMRLAPHHSIN
jgi:hypothetical protein